MTLLILVCLVPFLERGELSCDSTGIVGGNMAKKLDINRAIFLALI